MKKLILSTSAIVLSVAFFSRKVCSSIVFSCKNRDHCSTCHTVLRNCFNLERENIDDCVSHAEEELNIPTCLLHSHDRMSAHEIEAFMELENEDYLNTSKFITMFQELIEETEDKAIKELSGEEINSSEEISDTLKKHIMKLCLYANYHDNYENAKKHSQGNFEDIEHNVIHAIKNFIHESDYEERIQNFLGNPALCMKHPSDWVADRAHFEDNHLPSVGVITEEETELFSSGNQNDPDNSESISCNRDECNRFLDSNECENQIRMLNQGSCGNCWAFTALTVLQAFRCRKGYGFAEPSIKYLTLCKAEFYHDNPKVNACSEGGNITKFLGTLEKVKMLPTSHEIPYNLPMGANKCPSVNPNVPNLWEGVTLIRTVKNNVAFNGYLKFIFNDYSKNNKIEELIHILKDTIIVQGGVFITMRVQNVLEFDQNGSEILMHCQMNASPDHAMTLVGFGNYTKKSGELSSYWVVRNSWGIKWGDQGYFRLDMYGPSGCNGDVLSTAFPLNIEMKGRYVEAPLPKDLASTDLDSKHDVEQFKNKNSSSTSGSEKPKIATPEKPKETTPEKPKETTPEKPKIITPEKPKVITPEKPKETTPEKPKVITPEKPKETTPEKPKVITPEKPKIITPEKPKVITPEKPKETTPEKPKVTTPEKPKVITPEKPKVTTPEKPKVTTPEKPKVTTPEKPKVIIPEKPKVTTPEKPKVTTPEKSKIPQSNEINKNSTNGEVNPHVPFRGSSKPNDTDKSSNRNKNLAPEKLSVKDKIKQFESINKKFA